MAVSRLSTSSVQSGFPKYQTAWDGVSAVGSMDAISSVTLSSDQWNVDFNNIPQTYSHLQLRGVTYTNSANNYVALRFNGDNYSNYVIHAIEGSQSAASSYFSGAYSWASAGLTSGGTYPAPFIVDIYDYSNPNKYTTVKTLGGNDSNGAGYIDFAVSHWANTAPVTELTITHGNAGYVYNSPTTFTLYGIK